MCLNFKAWKLLWRPQRKCTRLVLQVVQRSCERKWHKVRLTAAVKRNQFGLLLGGYRKDERPPEQAKWQTLMMNYPLQIVQITLN